MMATTTIGLMKTLGWPVVYERASWRFLLGDNYARLGPFRASSVFDDRLAVRNSSFDGVETTTRV